MLAVARSPYATVPGATSMIAKLLLRGKQELQQ